MLIKLCPDADQSWISHFVRSRFCLNVIIICITLSFPFHGDTDILCRSTKPNYPISVCSHMLLVLLCISHFHLDGPYRFSLSEHPVLLSICRPPPALTNPNRGKNPLKDFSFKSTFCSHCYGQCLFAICQDGTDQCLVRDYLSLGII